MFPLNVQPEAMVEELSNFNKKIVAGMKTMSAWFSENPGWWRNHLLSLGFKPGPEPDGLTLCYKSFGSPIMDARTVTERLHHSFYYTWGDSDLF